VNDDAAERRAEDGTGTDERPAGMARTDVGHDDGDMADVGEHDDGDTADVGGHDDERANTDTGGEDATTPGATRSARYHGGLVAVLLVGAVGVLTGNDGLLLLALVPLAYVAYGTVGEAGDSVAVERSFDPDQPRPDERVRVRVRVENTGDRTLPDVRIVDDVPADTDVEEAPALATALRPGETATLSYAVRPGYGTYRFGPVTVRSRNAAGTAAVTVERTPAADTLDPTAAVDEVPLRDRTTPQAGRRPADAAGSGVEFYATREYRRGDPRSRIDWRRLARTGELTTVEFREERATTTVFVVDARPAARRENALALSTYAADRGLRVLREEGASAGALALREGIELLAEPGRGPLDVDPFERLDAGEAEATGAVTDGGSDTGRTSAGDGDASRDTDRTGDAPDRPSAGSRAEDDWFADQDGAMAAGAEQGRRLAARLPPRAQVVLCGPLLDDEPVAVVRALATLGVPVTVLSPDVTGATLGGRAAAAARRARIGEARAAGTLVVDWDPETRLALALGRALEERA